MQSPGEKKSRKIDIKPKKNKWVLRLQWTFLYLKKKSNKLEGSRSKKIQKGTHCQNYSKREHFMLQKRLYLETFKKPREVKIV